MQLDVAPIQKTSRHVSIGQLDVKSIIAAGLAVIGHVNHIGEAALTVYLRSALDVTRSRTSHRVSCDTSSVHVHTGSVVVVLQMAPQLALTDAATDTEVSFGAGGCDNPPAAGHEAASTAATADDHERTNERELTTTDGREGKHDTLPITRNFLQASPSLDHTMPLKVSPL